MTALLTGLGAVWQALKHQSGWCPARWIQRPLQGMRREPRRGQQASRAPCPSFSMPCCSPGADSSPPLVYTLLLPVVYTLDLPLALILVLPWPSF